MYKLFYSAMVAFCITCNAIAQKPIDKYFPRNEMVRLEASQSRANDTQILKELTGIDKNVTMIPLKNTADQLGHSHAKYQQLYKGIPVVGGELTIHKKRGQSYLLSGMYFPEFDLEVIPNFSEEEAKIKARNHIGGQKLSPHPEANKTTEMVILYNYGKSSKPVLAYQVDVYFEEPLYRGDVYIDAHTGKFIMDNHKICTANEPAHGMSLYNGNVQFTAFSESNYYILNNTVNGAGINTYDLNNTTDYSTAQDIVSNDVNFNEDPTAVQAHWGAENTYNYFMNTHGRNSYDGNGSTIKSYVHYNINYNNAYWDGLRMTYGDGNGSTTTALVSLDIVAHEITHGVTQFSAGLIYKYEPGALNESFSDIFGEVIEYNAQGSNDWLIGKDIYQGNNAFRSLSDPKEYSNPDTYYGEFWFQGGSDNGGVHTNSGVPNKWFYILSNGESDINDLGDSYAVTGIGMDKAAAIAYRNLTVYLTPFSNFYNAREGAIQSAVDLYGEDSPEVIATANAWYAVGVGPTYDEGSCHEGDLFLSLTFDNYPEETSWEILNDTLGVIYTSESYATQPDGSTFLDTFALEDGEYKFVMHDTYGDGVCCGYGSGIYVLTIGNTVARKGGYFGTTDTTILCIGPENTVPIEDAIAPTTPQFLSITNITHNSAEVLWSQSTDNESIAGYNVMVDGVLLNFVTDTSYILTGLQELTTYTVGLQAKDGSDNLSQIASSSFTTLELIDTEAPTIPTNLVISNITHESSVISWSASQDNDAILQYNIYIDNSYFSSVADLTMSLQNLIELTTYSVDINAQDISGNISSYLSGSFTTAQAPDTTPPTIPANVISSNITYSSAFISWDMSSDASGIMNYDLFLDNVLVITTTEINHSINTLDELTTYEVKVRARDNNGNESDFGYHTFITPEAPDTIPPTVPGNITVSEISSSSALLSWSPSSDNKGVSGYNIKIDGQWYAFTAAESIPLTGLSEATSYLVEVSAFDLSENESETGSIQFTTNTGIPAEPESVYEGYFETGWDGWQDGGSDCYRYHGRWSYEGSYSIRLRDNSGPYSTMTSSAFDLSPYTSVSFKFNFIPYSMEHNENFYVEYYDGEQWYQIADYIKGTDFDNNVVYESVLTISSTQYRLDENAKFRITSDASSNADKVYIDAIEIIGAYGSPTSLGQSVVEIYEIEKLLLSSQEEEELEEDNIIITPNPTSDYIFITAEEEIESIVLYTITGNKIRTFSTYEDSGLNLSQLPQGIYIISVKTSEELFHKSIIKK